MEITGNLFKFRLVLIVAAHAFLLLLSYFLAFLTRLEYTFFTFPGFSQLFLWSTPFLLTIRLLCCWYFDLFRGLWRFVSVRDLLAIIKASLTGTLLFAFFIFLTTGGKDFPRSVLFIDLAYNVIFLGGIRMAVRLFRDRSLLFRTEPASGRRLLIVGAGAAGEMILREIQNNPRIGYHPVGFVDDDPRKNKTTIHGVEVLGDTGRIEETVKARAVDEVIIAIPSADSKTIRKIANSCQQAGLAPKTLPFISDLIDGRVSVSQIRNVAIEDLLGRQPIRLDMTLLGSKLKGRVVMITGAAGSIGSELARQIGRFQPKEVILYDQAENDMFHLETALRKDGMASVYVPVIGDIKDGARLRHCLAEYQPSYVLHAAAYKHVPLMEENPFSAVVNNILGTKTLVEAVAAQGVEKFVLISSDKAVRPTNVMGATKRVAELIIQDQAGQGVRTQFVAVRFGNVLGSNGSVVPLFQKQIAAGGPVTITHPEVTRYFMTIPEAALLVIQAGLLGQGGEIFLLEMGEPVKIKELAENLIYLSGLTPGVDIELQYIGLRPGEKLYEELLVAGENVQKTALDKTWVLTQSQPVNSEFLSSRLRTLEKICQGGDGPSLKRVLQELVPDYQPAAVTDKAQKC